MMFCQTFRLIKTKSLLLFFAFSLLPNQAEAVNNRAISGRYDAQGQASQSDEFNAITTLYHRAYDLFGPDQNGSRRMLKDAARKLKAWIDRYEKDRSKLSFLIMQARLGLYLEAAGEKKEAIRAYKICLQHSLLYVSNATLTLCKDGEKPGNCSTLMSLSEVVTWRLSFLTGKVLVDKESQRQVTVFGRSKGNQTQPPRLNDTGIESIRYPFTKP
jgi:hypothetical protein